MPVRGAGAKTLAFAVPAAGPGTHQRRCSTRGGRSGKATAVTLGSMEEALGVGLLADPELERYQAAGHKIQITRLEFVYLALPAFMRQSHLLPAFQVEGIVSEGQLGISFNFGRFHHAAAPRAYSAADLYGPYLAGNPDGIAATATAPVLV